MNIKSLLLGSAAAMVAVSGAQAADAVVVEAEPVEYVRVCDAYGSGFFFIPGTETCIRFSGYVRTQFDKLDVDSDVSSAQFENETWTTRSRFDIDTRNETDWGTLRSLIRLQSNNGTDDGSNSNFEVDQAFISIAGLRAGIGGSLFNANFSAGMNLEGVGQIDEGSVYGFSNGHVLDYTYAIDGLTLSVGVEDLRSNGVAAQGGDTSDASVLVKVQYSGDFGTVGGVAEFTSGVSGQDEEDAYKVYATLDLSEYVPGGVLGGYYMWQDDVTGTLAAGTNSNSRLGGADDAWGIGYQMNLTDNIEFIAFYSQVNYDDAVVSAGVSDDEDITTIALNWYPVSGLKVFSAYSFGDTFTNNGQLGGSSLSTATDEDAEFDRFLIGLRRNF